MEGDSLAYKLGTLGLVVGVLLGIWRRGHLVRILRRCPLASGGEREFRQVQKNANGLLVFYCIVTPVFGVSVGGFANRMIPAGQVKVERAVIASMPGHGRKGGAFWLRLHMDTRQHRERLSVSGAEYWNFRIFDIVEVHSRPGIFGYDYVTDIVRIGSQLVGSTP